MRIVDGLERGRRVRIQVDGRLVEAYEGETVAAALLAAGMVALRRSPRTGAPRGAFCMMGVCQECVVSIDGVPGPSCRVSVREGLDVALGLDA